MTTSYIGGLRCTATSLAKLPACVKAGNIIGARLKDLYARKPEIKASILAALSSKTGSSSDLAREVTEIVAAISAVTGCTDTRSGIECGLHCEVRPYFLASWRSFVQDPDTEPERWFIHGSPLGIKFTPLPKNIFPEYSNQEATENPETLPSEVRDGIRSNAERDPDAMNEMNPMVRRGWIKRFRSKIQAKRYVGGRLILSKLIVLTKEKLSKSKGGGHKAQDQETAAVEP